MLNLMTGKELHNKPRGRNQRQASKKESNAYSSELKKKKKEYLHFLQNVGRRSYTHVTLVRYIFKERYKAANFVTSASHFPPSMASSNS